MLHWQVVIRVLNPKFDLNLLNIIWPNKSIRRERAAVLPILISEIIKLKQTA